MPELYKIITTNKLSLKIICSSSELRSIQKAELSKEKNLQNEVFLKKYSIQDKYCGKTLYINF